MPRFVFATHSAFSKDGLYHVGQMDAVFADSYGVLSEPLKERESMQPPVVFLLQRQAALQASGRPCEADFGGTTCEQSKNRTPPTLESTAPRKAYHLLQVPACDAAPTVLPPR